MRFLRNILVTVILVFLLADFLIVGYCIGRQYPDFSAEPEPERITFTLSSIPPVPTPSALYDHFKKFAKRETVIPPSITYSQAVSLIEKEINPKLEYPDNTNLSYMEEGREWITQKDCYRISLGQDFSGHYRRYRSFAVSLDGKEILELVPPSTEYKTIWKVS